MDAPIVSASEITSNPGNANLGYSSGVAYSTNPADTNPLPQVATTLDKIREQEAQMNVLRYHQKLKEQEELNNMLAQTGGSAFNVAGPDGKNMSFTPLPDDKKILDQRADELNKLIITNPRGFKQDADYLAKKRELEALKNHASQRAIFAAQSNAEAAKQNDVEERYGILGNLQNEVMSKSLTDFHTPSPHLNKLSFNPDNFISPDYLKNKEMQQDFQVNAGHDAIGNLITETRSGLSGNALDFRPKIEIGSAKFNEAQNMARSYLSSPYAQDPRSITNFNANIDKINAERGYAPGSPHFIPHISEVVNTPEGPQVKVVTTDPRDIAYALTAEHYGALQVNKDLKKTALEEKKVQTEITNENARTAQGWARLKQEKEDADRKYALAKQKQDKEAQDDAEKDVEINNAAATVLGHVHNTREKGKFVKFEQEFNGPALVTVDHIVRSEGIDPANYKVTHLNSNDETVRDIAGLQAQNSDGKYAKGVANPEFAYYLKSNTGNPADDKYLIGYKTLVPKMNEKGVVEMDGTHPKMTTKIDWKTTAPTEAVGNVIKTRKNFDNISDKTSENISRAISKYSSAIGGNSEPEQKPAPAGPVTASSLSESDIRKTPTGAIEVNVGGEWRKVKGKKKNGELVFE